MIHTKKQKTHLLLGSLMEGNSGYGVGFLLILNNEIMTKEEILDKHYALMPDWRPEAADQRKAALDAMEEYSQQQVKNCSIPDVSHSASSVLNVIKDMPQQGQVQYDLERQLRELRVAANKLGLYDAADFLRPHCG